MLDGAATESKLPTTNEAHADAVKVVPQSQELKAEDHSAQDGGTAHDHRDNPGDSPAEGRQTLESASSNGAAHGIQEKPDTQAMRYKIDPTPLPAKSDVPSAQTAPVGIEASPPAVRRKEDRSPLDSTVSLSQSEDDRTAEERAAAKKAIDAHLAEINSAAAAAFSEHGYSEDVLREEHYQAGATTPATPEPTPKPNVIKAVLSKIGFRRN